MAISGKANNIISRFPDFYHGESQSNLFYLFVAVFAQILEEAETDLLRVMRSHFVDTADNYGSQGLDAREKGDLDRMFALYLEKMGGTSQLIQVNQEFKVTDIKQISSLVNQLTQPTDSLSQYIWHNLTEEIQQLLKRYHVANTQFEVGDFFYPVPLVIKLIVAQDALTLHLHHKFSEKTKKLLQTYDGSDNISEELLLSLTQEFNLLLGDRQLVKKYQERSIQIDLASKLHQSLKESTSNPQHHNAIIITLGQILRRRLSLELQNPLYQQQEKALTSQFWDKVISELKQNFSKVYFCNQLLNNIQENAINHILFQAKASDFFITLYHKILEALRQLLAVDSLDQLSKSKLAKQVPPLFIESGTKDDLKRRNRLVLEAVYPDSISPSQIPTATEVTKKLVAALNQQILTATDLYQEKQKYFQQLALNLETEKLIEQQQKSNKLTHNQLNRLNRLLLEAAYPLSIQKSYDPYRERLKTLITVLRRGAATKEGIRDIVAANLGIFDDDPQAKAAKEMIRIEEYAQEKINISYSWVYPSSETPAESENMTKPPWSIKNPNPIPTTPNYLRVHLKKVEQKEKVQDTKDKALPYLIKPRFINPKTRQIIEIQYLSTTKDEVRLNQGDVLEFSADGTVRVNGTVRSGVHCQLFPLPVGESQWSFQASTEEPAAKFDSGVFDLSQFDNDQESQAKINKQKATTFTVKVEWQIEKQTPGIFHVIVPWHIEGFTDKFPEAKDHPRSQINDIVNRVKAAGVKAIISYEQKFSEEHQVSDKLKQQGDRTWQEEQPQQELNFDIRSQQSLKIEQEMSDKFIFSGVFDYTEFDSDNRFS